MQNFGATLNTIDALKRYKHWLQDMAGPSPNPWLEYNALFAIAFEMEFNHVPSIPMDSNRALDGMKYRRVFEISMETELPPLGKCRMLEFLIAISNKMSDEVWDPEDPEYVPEFFWTLIDNLGLLCCSDDVVAVVGDQEIRNTFTNLLNRDYAFDGSEGGLFPLRGRPGLKDQRTVEIWFQMHAYLLENMAN